MGFSFVLEVLPVKPRTSRFIKMEEATELQELNFSELHMTNNPVNSGDDSDELYDSVSFHEHDLEESLLATGRPINCNIMFFNFYFQFQGR